MRAGCGKSARPVRRAGCGNGTMAHQLRHRGPKGAATVAIRLKSPRHISTLPIEVDLRALQQPGWQSSLRRLWQTVSASVQPFYGDVRTLHGFKLHRGRLFIGRGTMSHPVRSWWWPGIPPGPVHAIVLGSVYAEMWPGFRTSTAPASNLYFVDTDDWSVGTDVYDKTGPAPPEIVRRDGQSTVPREYPVAWPFGPPKT